MKKPEKSVKRRKAAQARGKKRTDRAKKTQKNKSERQNAIKATKQKTERLFNEYLRNLAGQ